MESIKLHKSLRYVLPRQTNDIIRCVKKNDSGYVISKKALRNVNFMLSFSMSNNCTFEESFLKINNIDADFIGVGVASKDASTVDIKNSSFSNYKLFALMTYKKKAFYDYPVMNGIGIKLDENNTSFIRQENSYMQINGNIIKENELDVDNLYENEIMKK